MNITDKQVEALARQLCNDLNVNTVWDQVPDDPRDADDPQGKEQYRWAVRNLIGSLAAIEREPLEDAGIQSIHVDRLGATYYARGLRQEDGITVEYSTKGATIDEAIRVAIAAAKGTDA